MAKKQKPREPDLFSALMPEVDLPVVDLHVTRGSPEKVRHAPATYPVLGRWSTMRELIAAVEWSRFAQTDGPRIRNRETGCCPLEDLLGLPARTGPYWHAVDAGIPDDVINVFMRAVDLVGDDAAMLACRRVIEERLS